MRSYKCFINSKGKGKVKLLEVYAVTQWFYQLYLLYYQGVPENLIFI